MRAGAPLHLALQPSHGKRVRGQTEVGLGLAAARRKPEQVGDGLGSGASVTVVEPGECGKVQQDERKLKGIPTPVRRHIEVGDVCVRLASSLAHLPRENGPNALQRHGPVGEPERLPRLGIRTKQVDPFPDPLQHLPALRERLRGGHAVRTEPLNHCGRILFPPRDPALIGCREAPQGPHQLIGRHLGKLSHVEATPERSSLSSAVGGVWRGTSKKGIVRVPIRTAQSDVPAAMSACTDV